MHEVDYSQIDALHQVDCLIKGYLVKHALRLDDHRPVTAIADTVIDRIARRVPCVDRSFVERRLRTICEQVGSKEGVPTFQMKVDEQ